MKLNKRTTAVTGVIALAFSVAAIAATTDSKQGSSGIAPATSSDSKPALDLIAWPPKCPPVCASETQNDSNDKEST